MSKIFDALQETTKRMDSAKTGLRQARDRGTPRTTEEQRKLALLRRTLAALEASRTGGVVPADGQAHPDPGLYGAPFAPVTEAGPVTEKERKLDSLMKLLASVEARKSAR